MNGFDIRTLLRRLPQLIWFRLVLFSLGAMALVGLAASAGSLVPEWLAVDFGQDSALRILQILATSMLAVTTFSLTAMIGAYSGAAAGTTPRATQLLIADRTSQNALSSFLGTFVFAIVGIVALSTGSFTEQGRSLLFLGTLVVIAIVVITLLRWIQHLTTFGRVPDVLDRVEAAATDAICAYAREPHLGGVPAVEAPSAAREVRATAPGCVTGLDMSGLQAVGEQAGVAVHVATLPGIAVGTGTVLARVTGEADDDVDEAVRKAFRVENHRTYEQDPRLGLVALAEIGSRALSPATNDPGTAVEALNALQRVLTRALTTEPVDGERFPAVHVPTVDFEDMLEDALRPVARDGAAIVEVGLRIQRVIGDLIAISTYGHEAAALRAVSERTAARAARELVDERDAELVRLAALEARRTPPMPRGNWAERL
ncbi:DUF2254 domain-containing protein [Demequina aurantiaca]|uniref:DUF2254 domain-containing protein n=1 Tax=Demequina aurantiaca TaxID=676200 RepID=UPI003D32C55D